MINHTRIPVDLVLEKLAAGDSIEDLLNAYPNVTRDDIIACLLFAAEAVKSLSLFPAAGKVTNLPAWQGLSDGRQEAPPLLIKG